MDQIPQWVWSLVTLVGASAGAWASVKVAVAVLTVEMKDVKEDVKRHERLIGQHNDDLLTHDVEIEQAFDKLDLKRVRRQPLRGWET